MATLLVNASRSARRAGPWSSTEELTPLVAQSGERLVSPEGDVSEFCEF